MVHTFVCHLSCLYGKVKPRLNPYRQVITELTARSGVCVRSLDLELTESPHSCLVVEAVIDVNGRPQLSPHLLLFSL